MKLRNKKTGYITNWCIDKDVIRTCDGSIVYNSLAELNAEWEDAPEEPKEYWYIENNGDIDKETYEGDEYEEEMIEIGNYFDTKEEAEKAVEKLKAWKRLRDKGFRFIDHIDRDSGQGMTRYEWDGYVNGEDLDLLFGGEE